LTPSEVQEAANEIWDILAPDANVFWWMSYDDTMEDEVQVTIIATWFEEQSKEPILKQPTKDNYWQSITRPSESIRERTARQTKSEWIQMNTNNTPSTNIETNTETWFSKFNLNKDEEDDYETPPFMTKRLNNQD
jgi:cell division GTPase FtsZ